MTLLDFRDLVIAMARTEGTPYLKSTERARLDDLLQENLNLYAERTQCIQSDRVEFTPVVGTAVYETFTNPQEPGQTTIPDELSAALCFVRQVFIEGAALRVLGDERGTPGESSEFEVTRRLGSYLTADNGRPIAWWQQAPNRLIFNCPFDEAYTDCYIAGRLYHSPLLLDTQILDLPPADIRPAAMLCQAALLYPNAPAKASEIYNLCDRLMDKRRGECGVKTSGNVWLGDIAAQQTVNLVN